MPVIDPPVISTLPEMSLVTVTAVEVKVAAPIDDALPVAVMLLTLIVDALMFPATDKVEAVIEPETDRSPVTVAEVDVKATAPMLDALPVTVTLTAETVSYTHLTLPTNREV